jgi:hypothetical protein
MASSITVPLFKRLRADTYEALLYSVLTHHPRLPVPACCPPQQVSWARSNSKFFAGESQNDKLQESKLQESNRP